MSALQYKSKIKTPGVELGNEVVLTSPTTGRLNLGAKTETHHTRDNDVLTFDNLLKCSVELVGNGTGAKPSTMENLIVSEVKSYHPTKIVKNTNAYELTFPKYPYFKQTRGLYFKGVKRNITKITTTGPIYIETLIAVSDSDAENTNNWSCDMLFEHKLDK